MRAALAMRPMQSAPVKPAVALATPKDAQRDIRQSVIGVSAKAVHNPSDRQKGVTSVEMADVDKV